MDPSNFQILMDALPPRLGQQGAQDTTNDLLLQVVQEQRSARQDNQKFQQQWVFNQRLLQWTDQHEEFNKRQEEFNERQEKPNNRQDQFNIIFLDETRVMKKGIRELADVVLKQHESRLKRLEDFTGGFLRKAG